jgi:hypothetical protein
MFRLAESSLDFALSHIETFGDTDVLPHAFEFQAIRHDWPEVRRHLASIDLDTYRPSSALRCLTPKGRAGFRVVTQLDPYDTLILTALVRVMGEDIEEVRIGRQHVCSYRFAPDENSGRLYDPACSYRLFASESAERAKRSQYVVLTDIADFFPRIYSHRMENMLDHAEADAIFGSSPSGAARVLKKLLKALNQNVSRGLPVGPDATRILADLAITNVDQAMATEGFNFLRYSDDFRIFVSTEREGYRCLAFLAEQLDSTQILTLQASKTSVVPATEFLKRFGETEDDRLRRELDDRIDAVRSLIGIGDYEDVRPGQLSEKEEAELRGLQLYRLLDEVSAEDDGGDVGRLRIVVDAIAQLGLPDEDGRLISAASSYPQLFRHCVRAWGRQLQFRSAADYARVRRDGSRLVELLWTSRFGHLPYHRAWVLEQVTRAPFISSSAQVAKISNSSPDELTLRFSATAMWALREYSWFQARKAQFDSMAPWVRRAYLLGTTCLPGDEATHFYAAVKQNLSHLEDVVLKWARTDAPQEWRRTLRNA